MLSPLMRAAFTAASPRGRRAPLSILIFHRVRRAPDPLFPDEPDASRFDAICAWLADWLNVLPLSEAVRRLARGSLPARAACITFDDGYADNLTEALPILRRHGLPATFFIATGFLDGGRMWNDTVIEAIRRTPHASLPLEPLGLPGIGTVRTGSCQEKRDALQTLIPRMKYLDTAAREDAASRIAELGAAALPDDLMLTSAQLRELRRAGMEIGAHTVRHPILARCDDAVAREEIAASRARLEELLGERIRLFAYPNGRSGADYTPAHVRLVRELGFDAAVSTNAGASRMGDDVYQLCRFTPWDRSRWRFALRLARNALEQPIEESSRASPSLSAT